MQRCLSGRKMVTVGIPECMAYTVMLFNIVYLLNILRGERTYLLSLFLI